MQVIGSQILVKPSYSHFFYGKTKSFKHLVCWKSDLQGIQDIINIVFT
jgi:hypothetical protein